MRKDTVSRFWCLAGWYHEGHLLISGQSATLRSARGASRIAGCSRTAPWREAAWAHLVFDVDEPLRPPDGTDICLLQGQTVTRSGMWLLADLAGKHKQQHHAQQGRGPSKARARFVSGPHAPACAASADMPNPSMLSLQKGMN